MADINEVLEVFEPTPAGDGAFTASHLDEGHQVVFGGQLLAQSLIAAARTVPDKEVLSLHCVFARAGAFTEPLDIRAEVLQSGRAFATVSVTTSQSRGVCTRSTVMLHAPDADRIRHGDPAPQVGAPDGWEERPTPAFWDMRIVDDVDISDPALTGPAELRVWSRFPGVPTDDLALNQAMLAYASDGFLIATAMRPHEGIGQSLAHVTVSTTVLTQTLTFHEPFRAADWLLLDQRSSYAGRGRSHGAANVFSTDGRLVASFSQDNMIREMPEGRNY
ncbi:MAG: thioesterase family protein [Acidimicrobiia bacterium]|nr:thioesterase family protein [Acidimicrobiia bacterium]